MTNAIVLLKVRNDRINEVAETLVDLGLDRWERQTVDGGR